MLATCCQRTKFHYSKACDTPANTCPRTFPTWSGFPQLGGFLLVHGFLNRIIPVIDQLHNSATCPPPFKRPSRYGYTAGAHWEREVTVDRSLTEEQKYAMIQSNPKRDHDGWSKPAKPTSADSQFPQTNRGVGRHLQGHPLSTPCCSGHQEAE